MVTTAHDAEEALRPYLRRLLDARLKAEEVDPIASPYDRVHLVARFCQAQDDALDKALELLGVQR